MAKKPNISVHTSCAGEGLKEALIRLAKTHSVTRTNPFMESLIQKALKDKATYLAPLLKPREKGGRHISVAVGEKLKAEFEEWVKEENSTNAILCNYILEKAVEILEPPI